MKLCFVLMLLFGCAFASAYTGADKDNPSLRQALSDFGIPLSMARTVDLELRVSSGEAFNPDCPKSAQTAVSPTCNSAATLFAYYAIPREAESLSEHFYLFRKIDGRWRGGRYRWPDDSDRQSWDRVIGCAGGSIFPRVSQSLILIHGHNGPSAGCTMVFDAHLQPLITVAGLHEQILGTSHVILRQNLVHFSHDRRLDLWLVDIKHKTARKIYPSTNEFPARRAFRLAMAKRFARCDLSPECYAKQADSNISFLGDLNEDEGEFFYAPALDALMFSITVDDDVEKFLLPPEPWTAPTYIALYKKLLHQPEARFVDRNQFIDKFGEAALKAPPSKAILDWVWELDTKLK